MLVLGAIILAFAATALGDNDNNGWTHGASWSIPSSDDGYGSDGRPAATVSFNMGVSKGRSDYGRSVASSYGSNSRYGSGYEVSRPAYSQQTVSYQPAPVYKKRVVSSYQPSYQRQTSYVQPSYQRQSSYVQPSYQRQSSYVQPATIYKQPVVKTYARPVVAYKQPRVSYREPVSTYVQPAVTAYSQPIVSYQQPRVSYRKKVPSYSQVSSYNQGSSYVVAARPRAPTVILDTARTYGYATPSYSSANSYESDDSYGARRVVVAARPRAPTVILNADYGSRPVYSSRGSDYGVSNVVSSTIYGSSSGNNGYSNEDYGVAARDDYAPQVYVQPAYGQDRY